MNVCLTGNFQSFSNTRWNVPIAVQCAFIFILTFFFTHKLVHLPFFLIYQIWNQLITLAMPEITKVRFVSSLSLVHSSKFFTIKLSTDHLKQMDSVKLLVDWIKFVFVEIGSVKVCTKTSNTWQFINLLVDRVRETI